MFILKSERKRLILAQLDQAGSVSLDQLTSLLETSESTVRRDLDELEALGKLRRVHGGAEKLSSLQEELTNQQKSVKNVQEKRAIAQVAAGLIEEGEVIFIDPGTTTDLLVDALTKQSVTVVTNSIHHAVKLVDKGIKTIIIGGAIKSSTDASIGPLALTQIQGLNFDKAFLGMNGVDGQHVTTPDSEEAAIKSAIIRNSREVYVLADRSKLGQTCFVKVADLSSVSLITNPSDLPIASTITEKTRVIIT